MTTMAKVVPAVAIVVAAVAIYPSARGAYIRNRANAHLADATATRDALKSPVGAQALEGAIGALRLTLRSNTADPSVVAKADKNLLDVMKRLKDSPPPNQALTITAQYDVSPRAGATMPVAITLTPLVEELFVDSVAVEIGADRAWRTDPARTSLRQIVRNDQPLATRIDVTIPPAASGMGAVRVTVVYRLSSTGEGQDLVERSSGLPAVSIVR